MIIANEGKKNMEPKANYVATQEVYFQVLGTMVVHAAVQAVVIHLQLKI